MVNIKEFITSVVAIILLFACSACESAVAPTNPNDSGLGDVEFVVDFNQNNEGDESQNKGDGTAESPAQVTEEEPLNVVVSQESSYTDPNGKVYTCKPKASVEVVALEKRVYAEDIEALTKISEDIEVTTTKEGDNPVIFSTNQVFTIGGQKVVFDLSHEVYTYVNSQDKEIEMPYIKVNEANFGYGVTNAPDDTRAQKSPISLKALSVSRASITEDREFEVSARFNVKLESVNTESEQSQLFEIEVKYIGVVENVTELDGILNYTIENSSQNNEIVDSGELILDIRQVGMFSRDGESVYSAEPKATIKLSVDDGVSSATSSELLRDDKWTISTDTSTSGDNPVTNVCKKTFDACGKTICFDMSYEVYKLDGDDNIPYIEIKEPKLVMVEISDEYSTRAAVETRYYDVKATFEVELVGQSVKSPVGETLNFVVSYQAKVEDKVVGSISYTLCGDNGDNDSPFELNGGEEFLLTISGESSYTFGDERLSESSPKAYVRLKSGTNEVSTNNLNKIKEITFADAVKRSEGDNPLMYTCQKSFVAEGQTFDFDISYEVYTDEKYGQMPYLELGEPECVEVVTNEIEHNEEKKTTYYDVVAKFKVELMGVNVDETISQTLEFEVKYQAKVQVELLRTEYRKELQLDDSKKKFDFDIKRAVLYIDRYYSDGTIVTETLTSIWFNNGIAAFEVLDNCISDWGEYTGKTFTDPDSGFKVKYVSREDEKDYYFINHVGTIEVSSLDNVKHRNNTNNTPALNTDNEYWKKEFWGELTDYSDFNGNYYDPENPVDGWYSAINDVRCKAEIYDDLYNFRIYQFIFGSLNFFYCLDGELILFDEDIFMPELIEKPTLTCENITETDGRTGRVYKYNVKVKYFGHEYYINAVDYVYLNEALKEQPSDNL